MSHHSDHWYIRLPDAQVLRAATTGVVRHNIQTGQIPSESRVRRSEEERWKRLSQVPEFADLVPHQPKSVDRPANPNGQRIPPASVLALHKVGVRSLLNDLVNVLDSTLQPGKLGLAFPAGLALGLLGLSELVVIPWLAEPWILVARLTGALVALLFLSVTMVLVTQYNFFEMSVQRRPTWSELVRGTGRNCRRLFLTYLLVIGGVVLTVGSVRWLPGWLLTGEFTWPGWVSEVLAGTVLVLQVLLDVLLLPLLLFALLLGPIVVVEETGVPGTLRHWRHLLRAQLARVFLYETLATVVAVLTALPFVLPVECASAAVTGAGRPVLAAQSVVVLLRGLALTPALAFLAVANVHIYLNLRYQ